MGYIAKLKKQIEYDDDTPRCNNCKFRKTSVQQKPGGPERVRQHCTKHYITINNQGGLCKSWEGTDGTVLEP